MKKKYASTLKFKTHLRNTLAETHLKLGKFLKGQQYYPKNKYVKHDERTFQALSSIPDVKTHVILPRLLLTSDETKNSSIKVWRSPAIKNVNGGKSLALLSINGIYAKLPIVDDRVSDQYYIDTVTLSIHPIEETDKDKALTIPTNLKGMELGDHLFLTGFWNIMQQYDDMSKELRKKLPSLINELKENKSNYSVTPAFILHNVYTHKLIDYDKYNFFNSYFVASEIQSVLSNMYTGKINTSLMIPVAGFHINTRYHYLGMLDKCPKELIKIKNPALHVCIKSKTVNIVTSTHVDLGIIAKQAFNMVKSYKRYRENRR